MTEAQRRAEAIVRGMLARDQFSRWLGVEVLELGVGRCRCGMRVREEMVNGFGVAHGGIAFSLADSALAFASNAQGRIALSIENGMSYPAAIRPGDSLIATAEEETATNRLAFYRVRIANQRDEIVALFRGTVYRTSEEHPR